MEKWRLVGLAVTNGSQTWQYLGVVDFGVFFFEF